MRPIITDPVAWSVGLSVTLVSPTKTAEPIEMLFRLRTRLGPGNHVLNGVQILPPSEGAILQFNTIRKFITRTCSQALSTNRTHGERRAHYVSIGTFCRELCKNGWTDRFAVWILESGGSKEAQVQSYSPGGGNVITHHLKAHWRHLANTTEPSVCGRDAVLCQTTLTTCNRRSINS